MAGACRRQQVRCALARYQTDPGHSPLAAEHGRLPDSRRNCRESKSRGCHVSHGGVSHITIFKNHGKDAGASLEHPRSQLIAAPVISQQIRERFQQALSHYDEYGECMFCQSVQEELGEGKRLVMASDHFVAVEQFASPTPFCMHLYPRRHMASFGDINADEIADLARVLRTVLGRLYVGLQDPDFNYTIRTAPAEYAGVKYFHWYLSIIPRLARVAGFELGSGMFINAILPEAAAEFLRNVKLERAVGA
jgi:UDPglucose--hexose-1-phosphate uridylyltransferase